MSGAPSQQPPPLLQNVDVEKLREELRSLMQEYGSDGDERDNKSRARGDDDSRKERLKQRAREIGEEIRERLFVELRAFITERFGAQLALETTEIALEARNRKGDVLEVPVTIQARPLRFLAEPENADRAQSVLGTNAIAFNLYDDLVLTVTSAEQDTFWRKYVGDSATSIMTEAKTLVALKGGDWREPDDAKTAANVVAVRGLDFDYGLKENGNLTYDDTMYVLVHDPVNGPEVFEYRMTTESSSTKRGVGRLDSKQVMYIRGLHLGKDPGYRLKNDAAEGTRTGLEGSFSITGANIHSAYAKRVIDSATPLNPNVSLGCQVVASGKRPFENALVYVLDKKGIKEFPYTIVDGRELDVLDNVLKQNRKQSVLIHGVPRTPPTSAEAK